MAQAVAPLVEAEASVDPLVLAGAAGALAAFTDHMELSVDFPVAVGEVERSVVCLVVLEEEAVGAAVVCAASTAVWSLAGRVPGLCPFIPGATGRSGATPPPGAAAGPHTVERPSWQAPWAPIAAGAPTAAGVGFYRDDWWADYAWGAWPAAWDWGGWPGALIAYGDWFAWPGLWDWDLPPDLLVGAVLASRYELAPASPPYVYQVPAYEYPFYGYGYGHSFNGYAEAGYALTADAGPRIPLW
jgi:hypothetical protein